MATIANALSLTNGSANVLNSINKTINNTLSKTINNTINSTVNKTINSVSQRTKNLHFELNLGMKPDGVKELTKELSGVIESINTVVDGFKKMQSASETAIKTADKTTSAAEVKNKPRGFSEKFGGFMEKARGAVSDLWPSVQAGMEKTDKYARQNYQLESIAQNGETSDQLRQRVYSAAQGSRSGFDETLSTVAKLAKTSKDDFKTNDEVIYFTELVNKAFSGLGAEEAAQSINKVSEAMAKGKLQGDDLNALMEQSPMLAQALTRYTGQSQEQLAAGSGISDDVLKNAMYNSADDINNKFLQIPATFAQIGTLINDTLTKAFGPLLEAVANAATWIYNNWSVIEPIFWGIAGAVAAVTIAQLAMNLAFLACPLTWIILAIGAVIALIAYWIQSVGGIKVAWLMVVNALITAWDIVKIAFFAGVYWVIDLWNNMMLGIKSASVGIQNFFGDMKVGVLTILQDMVNGSIDLINLLIGALNHLPKVHIDPLEKVTFGQDAREKNDAEKMAREAELADQRRKVAETEQQHQKDIFDKTLKAASDKLEREKEIASLRDEAAKNAKDKDPGKKYTAAAFSDGGTTNEANAANLAATAANTGSMKNSMDIAEENLVYMRDIAEREAINKFTTSEISVSMGGITNNVNSDLDLDGVVSYMEQKIYETMTVAAEGVHY
ncbi:tape measure protein [Ruminiclostridium cellobioparum]|uniref:Tape measure domain protein n=1 Tax=Ruminiclostridium cellobioparum subsp. termitidis CT1112 TaxID=1195236 RepID=S0FJ01_RUMCE|nr:tape measure protein [Ruminiclostridium cellobioparum]EMS70201.1 tape measure domain protein [Ruminiclostridium cellobioparum subsp. termitidis CT1112]